MGNVCKKDEVQNDSPTVFSKPKAKVHDAYNLTMIDAGISDPDGIVSIQYILTRNHGTEIADENNS